MHISNNNTSEIDDENFFLAKDGKTNPYAELNATYHQLITQIEETNTSIQCRFPLRTKWIKEQLNLNHLPKHQCTEFNKLYKNINPKSVTLVFPNAHINSPASMFGHTFLRIDSPLNSKLLSFAINYAAQANQNTENGFIFALKGLFGGYYGKYSLLPYYDKLKEYRDTEQRDIWEYKLNLTQKEIDDMIMHIWEIKDSYSYYYFFDENCSYNILWLLEIARPSIHLRDNFLYHVSPPETLFAIKNANLIDKIFYRASKHTKLLQYEKQLDDNETKSVIELARGNQNFSDGKTKQQDRYRLEAAIELAEYYYIEAQTPKKTYLQTIHYLGKQRAQLGLGDTIDIPTPKNPLKAHRQLKLTAGYLDNNVQNRFLFGIAPSYHNLFDSDIGLLKGTQIEFFNYQGSIYKDTIKTEKLSILSLASLAPVSKFFNPLSWKADFSFNKDSLNQKLEFESNLGVGKTITIFNDKNYFYGLGNIGLRTNLKNTYIGFTTGAILDYYKFKTNLSYQHKYYDNKNEAIYNITQSFFYTQNKSIVIDYKNFKQRENSYKNIKLLWNFHF